MPSLNVKAAPELGSRSAGWKQIRISCAPPDDVIGLAVGDRELVVAGAQVLVRIDRDLVDAHLVVKVRTGGAARLADVSDDLSARHMLARARRSCAKDARRP